MNHLRKTILIGATLFGMSGIAFATHEPKADDEHPSAQSHKEGRSPERMKERMAKHQAKLHDKLKLTASQEPAWKTFITSMTPPDMGKRPERADMMKLSAPERADKMLTMMKEREAHMGEHVAAMKTFYAVLTPEQQKTFDANAMHLDDHHPGGEQGHGDHEK